jgi:hypothetical protein
MKETNCEMEKEHKGRGKFKKNERQRIGNKEMTLRNIGR